MCQTVSAQVQAQMDLFSRVDRRIDVLAQDLFGPTHWGSLIRMASLGLDHDLIDEARKFMLYCSSTVRRHGMAVWLYDIMNDASMALLLHKPAEHMPVIVNGPDVVNGRLRCGLDATVQRTGPTWQRECYNRVHSLHTYMLAAYCVAKWGEPGERRRELATLILNDWGWACACYVKTKQCGGWVRAPTCGSGASSGIDANCVCRPTWSMRMR